eukprot:gene28584-37549_t
MLNLLRLQATLILALLGLLIILITLFCFLQSIANFLINLVWPNKWTQKSFYKDKHVVITGGSSGIGLEIAREYLTRGSKVTIIARNKSKLDDAKVSLQSTNSGLLQTVSVDVGESQEVVTAAFEKIVQSFGEVDILVNSEFDRTDPAEFQRLMQINYLGSVYPTRSYAPSKWALRGFAEVLQMELKPYNVYVSVSYPPDTDTPGYQVEMIDKPQITKTLSESSSLCSAAHVAKGIVRYSAEGYFGIGVGMEGFLLKHLHAGMSPVNNFTEVLYAVIINDH